MPTPVQETTLTTCPPPSTAASIANLEYPEVPLTTAASVASGECQEMLPMALTEFSYECPDLPRADDSNINPEQTYVVCVWSYVQYYITSSFTYFMYIQCMHISCYVPTCVRMFVQCFQDTYIGYSTHTAVLKIDFAHDRPYVFPGKFTFARTFGKFKPTLTK